MLWVQEIYLISDSFLQAGPPAMRRWLIARPEHQHFHACRAAVHRLVPMLVEIMTATSEGEVAQLGVGTQHGPFLRIKCSSHAADSWHADCIEPVHAI